MRATRRGPISPFALLAQYYLWRGSTGPNPCLNLSFDAGVIHLQRLVRCEGYRNQDAECEFHPELSIQLTGFYLSKSFFA
jgi:hypothetical protein